MRKRRVSIVVQLSLVESEARWHLHVASFLWWMTVLAVLGDAPILDDILIARSTLTQWQVCFWFARENAAMPQSSIAETRAWLNQYFDGWCHHSGLASIRIFEGRRWWQENRCREKTFLYCHALYKFDVRVIAKGQRFVLVLLLYRVLQIFTLANSFCNTTIC